MSGPAGPGATLGLGETSPERSALRFSHAAMATVFEVHCYHAERSYAHQAAQAAFDLVDRLELELSRFIPNSDISRINDLASGESTRVSPSTMACLEIALRMHGRTGGAFDVALGSGLGRIELLSEAFVVRAREGGARLDLGGIGKGYAVDRMVEVLDEWEIHRALVHGGFSSVLALEPPPGRDGWPLTLRTPGPGGPDGPVRVCARQTALSASGTQKGDHIRDPRSGRAVRDRAAWVALSRAGETEAAAVAEALSTAFMILPVQETADLCHGWPGLEAWLTPEPRVGDPTAPALVRLAGPPPG